MMRTRRLPSVIIRLVKKVFFVTLNLFQGLLVR
jgi:hypothetical protein